MSVSLRLGQEGASGKKEEVGRAEGSGVRSWDPPSDGELGLLISWGQRRKMESLGEPDTPCPTT